MKKPVQLSRSKQVQDIEKRVRAASSVGETYNITIGEKLIAMLDEDSLKKLPKFEKKNADAPEKNVFTVCFETLLMLLDTAYGQLDASDVGVLREEGEDKEAMDHREGVVEKAHERVTRLRNRLESDYGEAFTARLGIAGTLPKHTTLKGKLEGALHILETLNSLPKPLDPDTPVYTLAALMKKFKEFFHLIGDAQFDVDKDKKETESLRILRREHIKQTKLALNAFNYSFEHLARLTGEHEIADKIRPQGGRPSQNPETTTDNTTPSDIES